MATCFSGNNSAYCNDKIMTNYITFWKIIMVALTEL